MDFNSRTRSLSIFFIATYVYDAKKIFQNFHFCISNWKGKGTFVVKGIEFWRAYLGGHLVQQQAMRCDWLGFTCSSHLISSLPLHAWPLALHVITALTGK